MDRRFYHLKRHAFDITDFPLCSSEGSFDLLIARALLDALTDDLQTDTFSSSASFLDPLLRLEATDNGF